MENNLLILFKLSLLYGMTIAVWEWFINQLKG